MTLLVERSSVRPRSVHTAEYKLLATQLREARLKAGLTQRDVAARLHKPASYPHKVENAERELNLIEFMDYCEALKIDVNAFLLEFAPQMRRLRASGPSPKASTE